MSHSPTLTKTLRTIPYFRVFSGVQEVQLVRLQGLPDDWTYDVVFSMKVWVSRPRIWFIPSEQHYTQIKFQVNRTDLLTLVPPARGSTDIVLHGPYTRKIRVLSIGAGVTGIMNAYHIQKFCENVEHVIFEKVR